MPVGFDSKKGSRRLRFIRNTSYNGTDYGPDYPQQECDVDSAYAAHAIRNGRAVEVKAQGPEGFTPGPQHRDPQLQHRDPSIVSAAALDLRRLSKPVLLAEAAARGVGATEFQTKAEIIASIEAVEAERL